MPVDTVHRDYSDAIETWRTIRDAVRGSRAVKQAGERYLPRLSDQTDEEYSAYRTRAQYFNATNRTLEVLRGSVFRKNPNFNQQGLDDFLENATPASLSMYDYCKQVAGEVLSVGRFGTLIDFPQESQWPVLCGYCAENIVNWRTARIQGRETLVLLVLHEMSDDTVDTGGQTQQATDDGYEQTLVDQWRVFRLVPTEQDQWFVQCEVYRVRAAGSGPGREFVLIDSAIPTRRGTPLARIPFCFHGPENNSAAVEKAPLEDIADVNLSHYRSSADLEHGRHFTGLPQPWAAGFDIQHELKIGSSTCWITESPDAKVGFLEFSGQGLGALTTAIEEKERQMAALGARMLMPQLKDAEAFDTVRIKHSAETSALMASAIALGQSMTQVLRWVAWWSGTSGAPEQEIDTTVEINTEFVASTLRPEEITALVAAWQGDAISWETLVYNLQRGELYPDDFDSEEERQRIAERAIATASAQFPTKTVKNPEAEQQE